MNAPERAGIPLRIADAFFVLRPTLWFPVWTLVLAGTGGGGIVSGKGVSGFLTIAALCALMGVVYLVNQLRDTESDRINDKLPLISRGYLSLRFARSWLAFLAVGGAVALKLDNRPLLFMVVFATFIITAGLYNLGRFALKDSPWGSLLATAVGGAGIWLTGWVLASRPWPVDWISLAAYTSAFTATGVLTMVPDMRGDLEAGKITLAVKLGAKGSALIALVLVIFALAGAVLRFDPVLGFSVLVSLPFFIRAALRTERKQVIIAIKVSILALSLAVSLAYFPLYLGLMVVYYFIARYYYRVRFDMAYPSFSSGS